MIGEFGRVMKDQNGRIGRGKTIPRRFEVPCKNLSFADTLVGEKTIGGLGIGPVLANQRDALADTAPQRKQESESLAQPLIPEHASRQFPFHPCGERISLHGYLATVLAVTRNIAALVSLLLLQTDLL